MKKAVIIRLFWREKIHLAVNDFKVPVLQTLLALIAAQFERLKRWARALHLAGSEWADRRPQIGDHIVVAYSGTDA
jgi:hypothetical protein